MPYDTEWSEEYLKSDGKGTSHHGTKLGEYRAFAALARAQGQREVARSWQELAEAEEKRLQWEAEQGMQALDAKLDPDGLDKQGQQAWKEHKAEETIESVEYCECGLPFGEGEHICSTEEPEYDYEPDEYLFREDHPNLPRWPATGRDKDRYFGNAINPIQWNWW